MNDAWTIHNGAQVYYTCDLLTDAGARHLFASRIGGVSEGCFSSWNFAVGVGAKRDDEEKVLANYEIAANLFGLHASDVCRTYQEHTLNVLTVGADERGVGTVKPKFPFSVDGLVSKEKDLLLSVRSADCVPILLYDPKEKICAAVHSGWRGTAGNIVGNAVRQMIEAGSDPKEILAAVGPSIGVCCFEVGTDVHDAFMKNGDTFASCFVPKENGKYRLDLWKANTLHLLQSGVTEEHISVCGLCTMCDGIHFFSHRRSGADRGTMSAFITV